MKKFIVGILLFGCAIQARAQLTCFECEYCPDPFDTRANRQITCGAPPTTSVTPPPGEDTTTQSTPQTPPNPETPILTPPPVFTTTVNGLVPNEAPLMTPPGEYPVGRWKRQSGNQISYRCFFLIHNGITRRGCAIHVNGQTETCRNANNGIQPSGECRICDWSGCNSASGLTLSIVTLLATLLITINVL